MRFLFLAFLIVPIVEIMLLLQVGSLIGVLPTIALVVLTAFIGVNLLRQQGAATLMKVQQKTQRGEPPAVEMIEGLVLAVGGALLLTPGFATDAIGFMCLFPVTRRAFAVGMMQKIIGNMAKGQGGAFFNSSFNGPFQQSVDPKTEPEPSAFEQDPTRQSPFSQKQTKRRQGDVFEGEIIDGDRTDKD